MSNVSGLLAAAREVIKNWESGNLAAAVNWLADEVAEAERTADYDIGSNEALVKDCKPCRSCGCTDRADAPGWGERCADCGAHGIDLEVDDEADGDEPVDWGGPFSGAATTD